MTAVRSRPARAVAAAVLVLALAALAYVAYGFVRGSTGPPAAAAQRLMPADTLVLVDVSTDPGRRAVRDAADLAGRFDAYDRLADTLLQRVAGTETGVDADEDVRPWLGDQGAIALTDSATGTAGSLVVVEVEDAAKARAFLARSQPPDVRRTYKGVAIERYGTVATAVVEDHLVIGQDATVQGAIDRAQGRGRSLADDPTYRRAVRTLPDDRAVTAYATGDGLDRLLIPQAGVLGTLSGLLDQPGLRGVAAALGAEGDDAKVVAHSILGAGASRRRQVAPTLQDDVPADAVATLIQPGVTDTLRRAFEATLAGTGTAGPGPILARLRRDLDRRAGGRLERDLLAILQREVALVVTKGQDFAPGVTLLAKAPDEDATRETLARLREPVAGALGTLDGRPPAWERADAAGAEAWTLRLPTGAALSYAVFDGRLAVSTTVDGIVQLRRAGRRLADGERFEEVLDDRPREVGSLGFIDFRQLLDLGEQTGLNDSRSYLAARDDLRRIGAVGVSSTGSGEEATAEILLSIP